MKSYSFSQKKPASAAPLTRAGLTMPSRYGCTSPYSVKAIPPQVVYRRLRVDTARRVAQSTMLERSM